MTNPPTSQPHLFRTRNANTPDSYGVVPWRHSLGPSGSLASPDMASAAAYSGLHSALLAGNDPSLEHTLCAAATAVVADIVPRPRSADELAKLQDPAFEYDGHRLEPLGRQGVIQLSEQLGISELLCWQLLQRTSEAVPQASIHELRDLAATAYHNERRKLLLLLIETLKLVSAAADVSSAGRPAARAFLDALEGAASATQAGSLISCLLQAMETPLKNGGGAGAQAAVPGFGAFGAAAAPAASALVACGGGAAAAAASGPGGGGARRQQAERAELRLLCQAVFYYCLYDGKPPPAAGIAALLTALRTAATAKGSTEVTDVMLLSALTALAPAPPPSVASHALTAGREALSAEYLEKATAPLSAWITATAGNPPPPPSPPRTPATSALTPSSLGRATSFGGAMLATSGSKANAAIHFTAGCAYALQLATTLATPPTAAAAAVAASRGAGAFGGLRGGTGGSLASGRPTEWLVMEHALSGLDSVSAACAHVEAAAAVGGRGWVAEGGSALLALEGASALLDAMLREGREPLLLSADRPGVGSDALLGAVLKLATQIMRSSADRCEALWKDDHLTTFLVEAAARMATFPSLYDPLVAALRSAVYGCSSGADSCHALLMRPPMQASFAPPPSVLMIPEYVMSRQEEIGRLQQQSMAANAAEVHRSLIDRFPVWVSALSLFTALASRSSRLATEWISAQPGQHNAIPKLVSIVYLGVPPELKAAALDALAALTEPALCSDPTAGAAAGGGTPRGVKRPLGDLTRCEEAAVAVWASLHAQSTSQSQAALPTGTGTGGGAAPTPYPSAFPASPAAGGGRPADSRAPTLGNSIMPFVHTPGGAGGGMGGMGGGGGGGGGGGATPGGGGMGGGGGRTAEEAMGRAPPELLENIKEDLCVEQRHQVYPQTLAFLKLLRHVWTIHAMAGQQPPMHTMHYVRWIADDLLGAIDGYSYRHVAHKWELTSAALAALLALLTPYDPSTCAVAEAPAAEPPAAEAHNQMKAFLIPFASTASTASGAALANPPTTPGPAPSGGGRPPTQSMGFGMGGFPSPGMQSPLGRQTPGMGGPGGLVGGAGMGGGLGRGAMGGAMGGGAMGGGAAAAAGGVAPAPGTTQYTLPALPPSLQLHCAFAVSRSALLHRVLVTLTAAAAALDPPADPLAADTDAYTRDEPPVPEPPAEAAAIFHSAALAMRLLDVLVSVEPEVRAKLKRLHESHVRLSQWKCWTPELLALLQQLHAEQWRSLPPLTLPALAASLSAPILVSQELPRCSAVGAIIRLLFATSSASPPVAAHPITLSGLSLLRAARFALGDSMATLLRSEGLLPHAREAFIRLLSGSADPPPVDSPPTSPPPASDGAPAPMGAPMGAAGGEPVLSAAATTGWASELWDADVALALGVSLGSAASATSPTGSPPAALLAAVSTWRRCGRGRLAVDGRAHESFSVKGVPSAQILLLMLDDLTAAAPGVAGAGGPSTACTGLTTLGCESLRCSIQPPPRAGWL